MRTVWEYTVKYSVCFMCLSDFDQRQRDSVRGRRGILQGVQPHRVHRQRGKCSPLHQTLGADHSQKHSWHAAAARDFVRQGKYPSINAGHYLDDDLHNFCHKNLVKINAHFHILYPNVKSPFCYFYRPPWTRRRTSGVLR